MKKEILVSKLFFCQTVSHCSDQEFLLDCISNMQKQHEIHRKHGNDPGCKIMIDQGARNNHSDLVYESLAESANNTLFQPIFKITFAMEGDHRFTDIARKLASGILGTFQFGNTIELLVFDGVNVINWSLETDRPMDTDLFDSTLNSVEVELSGIGVSVVDQIQSIIASMQAGERTNGNVKALGKPLWTSRTLILGDGSPSNESAQEWVRKWIGDFNSTEQVNDSSAVFTAGWGNNLIHFKKSISAISEFSDVFSSMQFIYAKLHLTNDIATGFLEKVRSKKIDSKSQTELKKAEDDFFYIEYTLLEAEYSLQGLHRKLLLAILAAWRVKDLIKNINYKIQRIKLLLSEALNEKYGLIQKNIRGLLLVIGIFEVLGAAVEIIHLSHSPEVELSRATGFLNLVHSANPDILITTLLATLIVLGLLAIAFGITKEGAS